MIAFATGFEAFAIIEVIETLEILGKSVESLMRISSTSQVQGINLINEQEQELSIGQFCKEILYDSAPINDLQLSEVMNERVLQVDRLCQSKWKYFPSGIMTVFTWALAGQALRHEFIIIDTENHICLLELKKIEIQNAQSTVEIEKLFINFFSCRGNQTRKNQRDLMLGSRFCDRVLASTKLNHVVYFSQINYFSNLLLLCWRQIYQQSSKLSNLDLLGKNSKQYARSIYYFIQENVDYDIIMQSIFGVFTDKPLHLPRLDLILFEKTFWHGVQISQEKKQQFSNFINVIRSLRNGPDFSQTTVS